MRQANRQYQALVLVCTNERDDGTASCGLKGSLNLYEKLKAAIKEQQKELFLDVTSVRVSKTGCLGNCISGMTVAIMPDNIYLGEVAESDIPEIVKMIMKRFQ